MSKVQQPNGSYATVDDALPAKVDFESDHAHDGGYPPIMSTY
jgi:hypothetical protein